MKKLRKTILLLVSFCLMFSMTMPVYAEEAGAEEIITVTDTSKAIREEKDTSDFAMWDKSKTYRILMVGNSKTYSTNSKCKYPNVCYMIREGLKQKGYKVKVSVFERSGSRLTQFAAGQRGTYRKLSGGSYKTKLKQLLKSHTYDIIILQEESVSASKANNKAYINAATKIGKWARKKNEKCAVIIRTSWPYKKYPSKLPRAEKNARAIRSKLQSSKAKTQIVYDGKIVVNNNMHQDNWGHATYKANYMISCLTVATLTGKRVTKASKLCLKYSSRNHLTKSKMAKLRKKAWSYYKKTKN